MSRPSIGCPFNRISTLTAAVLLLAGCDAFGAYNPLSKTIWSHFDPAPISRVSGYCHDPGRDYAYVIYRHESCGPNDRSISKAEWEANVAQRLRAYCVAASDGALYRGEPRACASGDETLTPDEWDKRSREASQLAPKTTN